MPPIRDVARSAVALLVLITSHRAFALEPGCPLASFDERARVGDALSAEFDAQGYDVQRGAMWVFTHADIEPDCQECSHANPSSTYGCAMLPVTDDPRNILRESRTVARVAESAATQVSAARRTATTRDADEQNADGRATDATFDSESETQQPDSAPRSPTSAPRPGGVFQAIMDTRSYLENRRDAMSILEAPALGLARPSLDDERTIARVLPDGPDLSCEWRLGDADVVVVVGCTPPPAKYFGLTSYVYRSYEAGVVRTIFGSLGDTLSVGGDGVGNDGNAKFTRLSTSAGFVPPNGDGSQGVLKNVPAWNTTFVTVLGKSRTVVQNVIDTLLASDLIPGDGDGNSMINKYGLSRQSGIKTNALLLRHAVPLDDAAWAQYADAPPFIVMRVTPRRPPLLPAPFPRATLIQRETFDERPLASSVTLLANRVSGFFLNGGSEVIAGINDPSLPSDESPVTTWASTPGSYTATTLNTNAQVVFDNGQNCIDTSWNCGGDNRDTTYITGPTFRLVDDNAVAYVIGANHASTGNSVYSNVAVYDPFRNLGIVAIDDSDFIGTADVWASGTAAANDADKLFVVALARKCPGVLETDRREDRSYDSTGNSSTSIVKPRRGRMLDGTLCVEVPSVGFPSAALNSDLVLWERPYCHSETSVGPWWNRLALPIVVLATRVGDRVVFPTPGSPSIVSVLDTF